jgi:hypothetical protein
MPQTIHPNPLGPLNPVSDSDAARLATPETHARLLAELVADLDQGASWRRVGSGRRFWGVPSGWHRPALLATVITAAAAMVLLLPGLLAGNGSATEPVAAQAQVLAHISAALATKAGTIVVEDQVVYDTPGAYTRRGGTSTVQNITATSANGAQERVFVSGSFLPPGDQEVWTSNSEAIYQAADNTIYTGTINNGGPVFSPGQTSVFKQQLDEHLYRLGGSSMIDGRPALKLVPVQAALRRAGDAVDVFPTVYVSPKTYYPIRSVAPGFPGSKVRIAEVVNWLRYKVLPATAANQRLVSLTARHPHARVDDNAVAFQRAYRSIETH